MNNIRLNRSIIILTLITFFLLATWAQGGNFNENIFDRFINSITVVAACAAAIFSWFSAESSKKNTQALIIMRYKERFASNEILEAMNFIRKWKDENGNCWIDNFRKEYYGDTDLGKKLDNYRRVVSHIYNELVVMCRSGLLSKKAAKKTIHKDEICFMISTIQDMELVVSCNKEIVEEMFDYLNSLLPKSK